MKEARQKYCTFYLYKTLGNVKHSIGTEYSMKQVSGYLRVEEGQGKVGRRAYQRAQRDFWGIKDTFIDISIHSSNFSVYRTL